MILFMNVPVGAVIRFNACRCIKLDDKHVRFLTDIDGNPVDYSKGQNARYARTTQAAIEGTPCWILDAPNPMPIATIRETPEKPGGNAPSALHKLSDGFDLAALAAMLLPLAFPAVAILDGAGAAYVSWSCIVLFLATLALVPVNLALNVASDICEWIANGIEAKRKCDESYAKAYAAYLLNGGRA